MSVFKLHKPVNGFKAGETVTIHERYDFVFEKYGERVELEEAPENKAIQTAPEHKSKGRKPNKAK